MEWKTLAIIIAAFACLAGAVAFEGQAQPAQATMLPSATPTVTASAAPSAAPSAQDVYVKALSTGVYDNPHVTVTKGALVRFHFSAEKGAGCGKQLFIPDFGVQLSSANGEEAVAEFTPTSAGTFPFRCGMNMFRGTITVK